MDVFRYLGLCVYWLLCVNYHHVYGQSVVCLRTLISVELDQSFVINCGIRNLSITDQTSVTWSIQETGKTLREIFIPSASVKYSLQISTINNDVTLTVNNVAIEDGGQYTLTVVDNNKTFLTTVDVTVEGPPRITNIHDHVYGPPGMDLLLDCRIQSWPIPDYYKWYHDSVELKNDINKYKITDKTNSRESIAHFYLKIFKFNTDNVGSYVCEAINKFGSADFKIEAGIRNKSIPCREQYKCNNLQTCSLDHGCICFDGYMERADGSCIDVDECTHNTYKCPQDKPVCINTESFYKCGCSTGYKLNDNTDVCIADVPQEEPVVDNMTVFAIVGVFMAIVVIIGILVIIFILKKRRQRPKMPLSHYAHETSNSPTSTGSIVPHMTANQVEIQYEIGKGRFGQVFIAKAWNVSDTGLWETVAIKQSRDDIAAEDKSVFLHELNLVKNIPYNRHIVRCVGYFYDPIVSMLFEYMPCGDLLTYIRQKRPQSFRMSNSSINTAPLSATQIFNFALQCAKGMQHLHENKIIHRDLAARNILVANENCCKISDFGMARKVGEDYSYTSRSKRPLPILWMAPEAIFNDRTSNKSDVWSYGVLFWEMVTLGSRPYPGKSGQQVLQMLKEGEQMEHPRHCALEIYRIMTDCWQYDPESRPEFHEIADEVEMRLDSAENYLNLFNYNKNNYYFVDHVSMSDMDIDHSESETNTFTRSRSRRSYKQPVLHL
ncbi:insulin-like growth factor 1 receptor [Patella vulgata]|uniref:insulin-like growth factor 1 receptor n=1 Tax=Patella vulgata TaxID=6465 RepID=UPI0021808683|nr:insulin-like growth factor 1 receptor [Patella vulgata]